MSIHSTFFTHTFYFAHRGSTPREGQIININDMELTLTTVNKTDIMDVFKKSRERRKIDYLRADCKRVFNGVVHNCCKVTANNHKVAFVIYRSVLGFPMLEQIDRPDNVLICEGDDCVVVKDGYAYELTKRVE